MVGDAFADFVRQRVEARNGQIVVKQKLVIDMDPEVAAAFMSSTAVNSKYLLYYFQLFFYSLLTNFV